MTKAMSDLSSESRAAMAGTTDRFIAKFVDLLIAAALSKILSPVGFFAGIAYLLIADGFWEGQSIGKRITRIQVCQLVNSAPASFRESVIRNAPLAFGLFALVIPYLGPVILVGILAIESLLLLGNDEGKRIGDELAGTWTVRVVATEPHQAETGPTEGA